jgi:hypothetical protein
MDFAVGVVLNAAARIFPKASVKMIVESTVLPLPDCGITENLKLLVYLAFKSLDGLKRIENLESVLSDFSANNLCQGNDVGTRYQLIWWGVLLARWPVARETARRHGCKDYSES